MDWRFGYSESVSHEADCLEDYVHPGLQKQTQMTRQTTAFPLGLVRQCHASPQMMIDRLELSCPLPAPTETWK